MRRRLHYKYCFMIIILVMILLTLFVPVSAEESGVQLYFKSGETTTAYKDCTWEYGTHFNVQENLIKKNGADTEVNVRVSSVTVQDDSILKVHDVVETPYKELIHKKYCPICGSKAQITSSMVDGIRCYEIACSDENCSVNIKSEWSEEELDELNDVNAQGRWRLIVKKAGACDVTLHYTTQSGEEGEYTYTITVPQYHTVIFKYDDEEMGEVTLDTQFVADGKSAAEPENIPSRPGYKFQGWSDDFSKITSDLIVTALWEKEKTGFKITNVVNGEKITWECDENGVLTVSGKGCALIIGSEYEDEFISHKKEIKKVIVKKGITEIWSDTFKDCTNVTEVVLSEGLNEIQNSAFENCSSLTEIQFPEGLKNIGWGAFRNCTKLKKIEIPESIEYLWNEAFYGCSSVKYISLPKSLEQIEADTFRGCSAVTELVFPEGIKNIYDKAFADCTELIKVNLPASLEWVSSDAFEGCAEECCFYLYKDSVADQNLTGNKFYLTKDTEAPVVQSISMEPKTVTVGDTVTVTMEITDESSVKDDFKLCVVMGSIYKQIVMKHTDGDRYVGKLPITKDFVNGEYSPAWADLYDSMGNGGTDYLRAFKNVTFVVTGAVDDNKAPQPISLSVDKDEALKGDAITYELILKEKSGLKEKPRITFKNAEGKYKGIYFDPGKAEQKGDLYVMRASLNVDDFFSQGRWKPEWLSGCSDIYGNEKTYYYIEEEFPECHFTVYDDAEYLEIPKLKNTTVFYDNFSLKDRTIEGDLYIGPDSVSTLKDFCVTGKIYVLGGLNASSIQATALYARAMSWSSLGTWSSGNGRVCISGTNKISDLTCSNYIIQDMPLKIDGQLKAVNGKLDFRGIDAGIADLYANGKKVETQNGKFILKGFDVSDTDELVFSWKSNITNIPSKTYRIDKYMTLEDGSLNALPVITASDKTYCEDTEIDYAKNAKAKDVEDGDISGAIQVDSSRVDVGTPGKYSVTYTVTDHQGGTTRKTVQITIVAHDFDKGTIVQPATCETEGEKESICKKCQVKKRTAITMLGHDWDKAFTVDKEATCTEEGSKSRHCMRDGCSEKTAITVIPAMGHTAGIETRIEPDFFKDGKSIRCCERCGTVIKEETLVYSKNSRRLAGNNRYRTSELIADALKQNMNIDKFNNIIVASGKDYPDALAGSYLAKVKNAPILLTGGDEESEAHTLQYIFNNLSDKGRIYILGGEGAVSKRFEKSLDGISVKRLGGTDRYDTNLKILKEANAKNTDLLVCTGNGFADSLSASAAGRPILLVKDDSLTKLQKSYLVESSIKKIYLIGGTGAVKENVAEQLKSSDMNCECARISGKNRYETSKAVATEFFAGTNAGYLVLAYAQNFPDGLSGGPLALSIGSPLILADQSGYQQAVDYAKKADTKKVVVLGGRTLISDDIVERIVQ